MSHDDFIGEKYGRLTVLSVVPKDERIGGADARRRVQFLCECECGNKLIVTQANLTSGRTVSCGCYRKDNPPVMTHGLTRRGPNGEQPRLYRIWQDMKCRCYKSNSIGFHRYGGRGITVCEEWRDSFETFHNWAMSHGYAENLTIDRQDNDGPYSPENCRWATKKEQARNTSRSHKFLYDGKVYTMYELAAHLNVSADVVRRMWYAGELIETNKHIADPFSGL